MPVRLGVVRFGLFEVDLTEGVLMKNGHRIKLQEQPCRLLSILLEHPGETVTREELRHALWPADTFVDFDRGLNAAVAKLRQALGDSAENPRFIETLARRGYRFIAPVQFHSNANGTVLAQAKNTGAVAQAPRAVKKNWTAILSCGAGALAVVVVALWFWNKTKPRETELIKLTEDSGLTTDPAVSPDESLLAYASDRSSRGNLNIWIQQLGTGAQPVQLTHFNVDANEPAFSSDGSTIAFSSRKDGGGIYTVPVIGGEPTRLTHSGRSPHFSPDGHWIAYWSGAGLARAGTLHIVSTAGGEPRRLAPDLSAAANPVWSPDSKYLIVYVPPATGLRWDEADWWLAPLDGTFSRRTGDFRQLVQQGFSLGFDRMPQLSRWDRGSLIFAAAFGDSFNSWRLPVSNDGRITGTAERLTSGTTLETSPIPTANHGLVFASLNHTLAIWSVAADPDRATITGDLKTITAGPAAVLPSISTDGRMLAFNAVHSRGIVDPLTAVTDVQIRVKDLSNGKETVISRPGAALWHPQISRDGTMVSYNLGKPGPIYVVPVPGESPKQVVRGANKYPWDWSLDDRHLLFCSPDARVHSIDLQSSKETLVLEKPGFDLYQAKFSPDDSAIAVEAVSDWDSRLFVVPVENGVPTSADSWIPIDHQGHWDDKPRWSPDGSLIYFVSDRDDYQCLWAQRVTSRTRRPLGQPFPVYHFHNARLSMANVDSGILEIAVAKDKIVWGLGELTGNIWSLRRKSRK